MKGVMTAVILVALTGLVGCGGSHPKDLIVGKWERLDETGKGTGQYDVYTKDGKVSWGDGSNERDYKVLGTDTIEYAKDGKTFATYKFTVTKDELTLIRGDGEVEKLRRAS
jgi:hypothetical protein